MGDTIYSDTEVPGYTFDDLALTVEQKWEAYKTNLRMKPWAKARGSAAYYAHWDDHEFINDFAPGADNFPLGVGTVEIDGEELYKRGVEAFTDYNPITYSKGKGIYRSVRWGKNLEVFFLDERSFRSTASDYTSVCDNPPGTRDFAPTAPQSVRDAFSVIAPALGNPVPQACLDSINDPNRTLLGSKQLKRFKKEIANSKATFKVIMNELPIQQYYVDPYDRWEGYEAERQEVLHYLQDKVENVVFLTADVHASLVNDARYNTLGPAGVQNSGILDVTTGPIATANYGLEISDTTRDPQRGRSGAEPVPQAPTPGRSRDAVRLGGPVQLRAGRGDEEPADDRPARSQRPTGPRHRRQHRSGGAALRPGRDPEAVAAPVEIAARFPGVELGAGHYESFYLKLTRPGGGRAALDPPHRPQAARRGADRGAVVHALRRRRLATAGGEADRAGRGAERARGCLHRDRGSAAGAGPRVRRAGDRSDQGRLGARVRGPGRALPSPAVPVSLRRARCRGRSCSLHARTPASRA